MSEATIGRGAPGGPQPGWVRRLAPYLWRHRRNVAIALGGALVGSAAQAIVPLVERQIVDNVIVHHRVPLAPWLSLLVGLGVLTFFAAFLRRYRGGRVALDVQYDIRNDMYDHLHELDFAAHDAMPTGQLVGRANSDTALVQGLLSFFPIMSGNVLLLVASLGIMVFLSPLLAIVSLLVLPSLLAVAYLMRSKIFPATWDGQQREGDVAQIVDETVSGVRVVKAFGQESRELDRIVGASTALYGSQMRAVRLQARYQPLLQAIPTLGQVGVLALGGYLALEHRITIGTFLAFSTYLVQLVGPARMLAGILTVAQQARAGLERIFQLLDLEPIIEDRPGATVLGPVHGAIDFEAVDFSYDGRVKVLDGFDLHVAPGEVVALVGPSGSGKSTAAMLISRFYDPDSGVVRVDGHDVREVTASSLRGQVGVVFEESFLFSDSVASNIALGRPGAAMAEVVAAAKAAEAHEFVEQLPDGYDTVVGERGLSLSGGQRQRIALARAILYDARILVLDDATSAIDSRIEAHIHQSLHRLMEGRSTVIVAHRRSTLRLANRIVVMDRGRVVDEGTHEALLRRCGLYASLLAGPGDLEAGVLPGDLEAGALPGDLAPDGGSATTPPRRAAPAWKGASPRARAGVPRPSFAPLALGAGLGPGMGGGRSGWRANLAPTPELLEKVAALRPVRDAPEIDLGSEIRHDPRFSLGRFLRPYRGILGLGLVLVVADSAASLAGPLLVRSGIDNGVLRGSKGALFVASALFLAVALVDLGDTVAETFVTGRTAEKLMFALRVRIFAQLQRLSLDYYEHEMGGRIMTRMTTDVDSFETLLETGLISAVVNICTFFGVGAMLLVLNFHLALATLGVIVPLVVATVFFRQRAARVYELARDRIAAVNADFQESLAGVRETQAFVHEAASKQHFHGLGASYLDARLAAQRLVSTYFPFVQFLADVGDAIVLGVGAGLVASGHLSIGALIAFVLYLDLFFAPIQQLSQVFDSWQQARVSVGRIGDLMALSTLTPPAPSPVRPDRLTGEIVFEDVRFSYPPAQRPVPRGPAPLTPVPPAPSIIDGATPDGPDPREALRGVDLTIRPGETVALVGETGAGKSTIVKLIARFYDPTAGRVLVDGTEIADLDLTDFRQQLGYVPQEAFLFTGTIRDNIAYGRPDASDDDVAAAAEAVGADRFIEELPNGYTQAISERGRSLSAGQRQLIALARAELVDPAILLLDEATSNLDLATEARVAAAMDSVSRGRTTVVIAHRLQTARAADRIVVLQHGTVAEQGSHDELLGRGGAYAKMWEAFDLVDSGAGSP